MQPSPFLIPLHIVLVSVLLCLSIFCFEHLRSRKRISGYCLTIAFSKLRADQLHGPL